MAKRTKTKRGTAKGSKTKRASKRTRKATGAKAQPAIPPKRLERGRAALALRKKHGWSWGRIGQELGVSGSYARNVAFDASGGDLPPMA